MAEKIVYNTVPPVPSDFQVKQNSLGTWDVINNNTGIYEGNYNTKVAADTYTNQKVAGVSEKASQAAAVAADTGQPSDSKTTATNYLPPTSSEIDALRQANAQKPLTDLPTNNISPAVAGTGTSNTTVSQETLNGTTNTVTTTTPDANAPASQQVASVSVDHVAPPPPQVTFPSDWRVRLSLASAADYLYKDDISSTDILFPLKATDGVIFPYLPQINMSYRANYSPVEITHTNYKNYFYTNSSVDDISIVADFTAQDNVEAKYMLAVIHFFRCVTKMFYGQDSDPRGGTPPPLCYLSGLGAYQFNNHPLVISSFSYQLPNDVDYIRTETLDAFSAGGMSAMKQAQKKSNIFSDFLSKHRLGGANLNKGAQPNKPNFSSITTAGSGVTYVPTKLQIQIGAFPIVTRKDISENFKLNGKDNSYSSGSLTQKGIW